MAKQENVSLPTKDISPECQIVVFDWLTDPDPNDSIQRLASTTPVDVSNYIREVSYSKNMSSPAGQFQFTLENDRDWKQYIKKGCWCIIYMSNDGGLQIPEPGSDLIPLRRNGRDSGLKLDVMPAGKLPRQRRKIRCIGYIDTVRAQGITGDEKGELDITYVVQGRDIGVVYEETEIWHNRVQYDQTLLNTALANINANAIKTVDGLLEVLHQLIFAPEQLVNKDLNNDSLTSIALQWLLPNLLFTALGFQSRLGTTYYGNIPNLLNFEQTLASYPVESPVALMNGIAWDRLKQYSIEPFHELFPELDDEGRPRLNFRPIPWRISNGAGFRRLAPTITKFKDLPRVELDPIDILEFDFGEDDHARYNLFWSTINSSSTSIQTSLQLTGDNDPSTGFPRVLQNDIRRHGLRMMYSEVNANITLGSEKADPDLLRQYNELQLEYWDDSHNLESGTMDIQGRNDIRLGKVVKISEDAPYNANKYFYIEGYEETFIIDEKGNGDWTQSLMLTRGIEEENLNDGVKSSVRRTTFSDSGEFTNK